MQRHDKMAPADSAAPGGGPAPVVSTSAPPAVSVMTAVPTSVAAPPPAVPVAPLPAAEPKAPVLVAAEVKAPVAPVEAKKADKPEAPADPILAEFEAFKAETAALKAALEAEKGETRRLAFEAAFDRAGVQAQAIDPVTGKPKGPQYRDFLRSQLGDVDPRSDVGKAAIDALVSANPAMRTQALSTEDPTSAYLRAKTAEAKAAGQTSMWGLIPADMMRGYDVGGGRE